jgi:signal transduction histidine kinase
MLRRISTKLILAVLVAVVLPFGAFALFINYQMETRLTKDVVTQALKALVQDLAGQIDSFVDERRQDAALRAQEPMVGLALDRYDWVKGLQRNDPGRSGWDAETIARWAETREVSPKVRADCSYLIDLTREFDSIVRVGGVYDLMMLVADDGRLAVVNSRLPGGTLLPQPYLERLFAHDFRVESWFAAGLAGEPAQLDRHASPFRAYVDPDDPARNYHVAFSQPVRDVNTGDVAGVLFLLVNWAHVRDLVAQPVVKEYFRGLAKEEENPTPYAWIWGADADTIIAHPDRDLYGKSITRDVRLPQMVADVRASEEGWDTYTEYYFQGKWKNAAFKRTNSPEEGGFHWVVGLGIDNDDIYATSTALRNLLLGGTGAVLLVAVLLTMLIARRTTEPIRALQRHARRVAEGRLDEPIEVRTRDELGALARDFNTMIAELSAQRDQLVRAEKDAAWREMARQIAHDIKNPLTPIQLSLDLVERARREGNPAYDEILERTLEMIARQVVNLRDIASNFYEFTGGRRPEPQEIDLGAFTDDVLRLHDAWAVESGVHVARMGAGGRVRADPGKLRRVLGNLVANALQAMPDGGELQVEVGPVAVDGAERVRVLIRDTGSGISADVRAHLFEPYFTTKSEGTGLGLAIAARVVEDMGGTIELRAAADEPGGTIAEVTLPASHGAGAAPGGVEADRGGAAGADRPDGVGPDAHEGTEGRGDPGGRGGAGGAGPEGTRA